MKVKIRRLLSFVLVFLISLSFYSSPDVFCADEIKIFTYDYESFFSKYVSYATCDDGKSWVSLPRHMSEETSLSNDYTVFRTYIPLDRIIPAGATVNYVRLNYRNGPGNLDDDCYIWFGNIKNGVSVNDACRVNVSSVASGVILSGSSFTLNNTIANCLFIQYDYNSRSGNTFFFAIESVEISYTYDSGTGDLFDTNEKLDIQLQLTDDIWENIKIIAEYIIALPSNIAKAIVSFFEDLGTFIVDGLGQIWNVALSVLPDDIEAALRSSLTNISNGLSHVVSAVSNLGSDFGTIIDGLDNSLSGGFADLGSYVVSLPGRISEALNASFDGVKDGFFSVGDGILSGLTDLFVPEQSYFETAFDSIAEKLPFVGVIVAFFQNLWESLVSLNTNECPEPFVVDVVYSGQVLSLTIFDLSWYEPYKPYGDLILSGFIIFTFVTNIFFNLNNIIRGTNSDIKDMSAIAKGD